MKILALPILLVLALPAFAATPARKPATPAPAKTAQAAPPTDPVAALLEQSRDAQARGEAELALRLAQSAIVADPARPGSYVALGDLYAAAGQGEFARSYYDAALDIDPADTAAKAAVASLGSAKATAAK
jgi:tetratricopeptide (TPR) repeat protein